MISLEELITRREVNTRVMALLQQRAVAALIQLRAEGETGAISARSFIFSDDFRTLHIHPVSATPASEQQVVAAFGEALLDAVIASPSHPKRLIAIATACTSGEIRDLDDLDLRLERRLSDTIYLPLIAIILACLILLYCFSSR
ncbi:MAG: hypothetical protein Q4B68_04490 [Bacteroidales bacterium]|nr:hypothetical protein [Bacteroidales bacterium]